MKRGLVWLLYTALAVLLIPSVATAQGEFQPFMDGDPVSASQMNANIALLEGETAEIRDQVIAIRRLQFQIRDRTAEFEDLLGPAQIGASTFGQVLEPQNVDPWPFSPGTRIDARHLNAFFEQVRSDHSNIHEFNKLLHREALDHEQRLTELAARYSLPAPEDQVALLPEAPEVTPIPFSPGAVTSAEDVNANFEALLNLAEKLSEQAHALDLMVSAQQRYVTELSDSVGVPLLYDWREGTPQCADVKAGDPYRVHNWSIEPASPAQLRLRELQISFRTEYETTVLDALSQLPEPWGLNLSVRAVAEIPEGEDYVSFVHLIDHDESPLNEARGVSEGKLGIIADDGQIIEITALEFRWSAVRSGDAGGSSLTWGPILFACDVPVQYTFK